MLLPGRKSNQVLSELKFKVPKVMVVKELILSFDIKEVLNDN